MEVSFIILERVLPTNIHYASPNSSSLLAWQNEEENKFFKFQIPTWKAWKSTPYFTSIWNKSILHLKNSGIVTQEQQKSHCSQLRLAAFQLLFWRSNSNFFLPFPPFVILHFKGWHINLNPKFLWLPQNWDTNFMWNKVVWKNKFRSTILVLNFFLFSWDE